MTFASIYFPITLLKEVCVKRTTLFIILLFAIVLAATQSSAYTLSGTIRDFCAPVTANCTQLSDFEGAITGVTLGMLSPTLTAGLPTYVGVDGYGATTAANFAKWYEDSPGYNLGDSFSLTLTPTATPGEYSYSSNSFFPIDGKLYGNQLRDHNYHFTLHLEGMTSFKAADTFTFTGDDDLWIYIGGKQVIDLGGVHSSETKTITGNDLIAAGLVADTLYDLDVFFAERHTVASNFTITTSFRVESVPEPATLLLLGLGLFGMAGARRFNK